MSPKSSSKRITLSQIAKEVGLSSAAVSMALRGHKRISPVTQEKVAAVATRLGYVYDRSAARLRTGQSNTIGIIISDISNPFFAELVAGVDDIIDPAGKISILINSRDDQQRQLQLLNRLREQGVDGIIICPAPGTDEQLFAQINSWGMPCVQMLRRVTDLYCDYVSADYHQGITTLCEHLIKLGHRRIAYIGSHLEHSAAKQRLSGFQDALKKHGLKPAAIECCDLTRRASRNLIKTLIKRPDPPTAAVCYSDIIAFGLISGLHDLGIEAGRDFAVTGFDNSDEAQQAWPPLTTAASHAREIGKETAKLLLRRIAEPEAALEKTIIPTEIIIRKTCGS